MPQMGYDMREGTVVRWLKSEGSDVQVGEPIAEIETDKAVVEFESYAAGVLQRILVSEGGTVPVGQPIALIGAQGEPVAGPVAEEPPSDSDEAQPVADMPEPPAADEEEPRPALVTPPPLVDVPAPEAQVPDTEAPPESPREVRASPVARRLAAERGVDLSRLPGTGPGGRITRDDVLAAEPGTAVTAPAPVEPDSPAPAPPPPAPAEPPAPASDGAERVPLSRIRQQIARVTVRSKQEKPHFYASSEIDVTRAMELRRQINQALESEGLRVSVNDLIIKACVEALKTYPNFNAFLHDDGIQLNEKINIGIAIDGEEGLIMPAIMDCADRSLKDIAAASKDLAARAKDGALHPQEYSGGTFAISNMGMFDITSFVAIIQPPQTAVLAVGTVGKRPVVKDDQVAIAQTMTATLSADHRIVDGAEGARFLNEVKRLLENPLGMLV